MIKAGRKEEFRHAVAWWINATKAYTSKLVNPGGDEPWKGKKNSNVKDIDEKSDVIEVSPRQVIDAFIDTVNELGLPHPPHIHCNNLGHSGNFHHDPGDHENGRGQARSPGPYPVPQLRGRTRQEPQIRFPGDRRIYQ